MDSEDPTFDGKTVGFRSRATLTGVDGLAGWTRAVRPGLLRRADPAEVTAALAQLTRFGPFFAVHLDQPDNAAPSVAERISSAASRLGTQDRRVAASILFQGIAARLWSPVLGCLATVGIVPDLPAPTQWQLRDDGGGELCVPHPGGWIATEDADDVAALVERIVIRNVLQPLAEEFRAAQPIACGLLWGNVASALVGTLRVLQRGAADNRAADDPLTVAVVLRLLDAPPLAGTAALGTSGKLDDFRRRSCCLYYRIPHGGRCGDCALDRTPTATARSATARSGTPTETTSAELSHPSRQDRRSTVGYPIGVITSGPLAKDPG